jgi:hypothetical protein
MGKFQIDYAVDKSACKDIRFVKKTTIPPQMFGCKRIVNKWFANIYHAKSFYRLGMYFVGRGLNEDCVRSWRTVFAVPDGLRTIDCSEQWPREGPEC